MSDEPIDEGLSQSLYALKAFCILSVVCAHMPIGTDGPLGQAVALFATVGVVGFFVVAGYLLDDTSEWRRFWRKKVVSLVVPWLFCSTLTFLVSSLTSDAFHTSYASWVLGSGSWYYFVPMLLLCYAIFRLARAPRTRVLLILLGFASILLTSLGLIQLEAPLTASLNVLNWIPFFGIGTLLRERSLRIDLSRVLHWSNRMGLSAIAFAVLMGILCALTAPIGYWGGWLSSPFELSAVLALLIVAGRVKNGLLVWIGRSTYPIYLLHMQLAGFLNTRVLVTQSLYLLKPMLVLAVMCGAIALFARTARLLGLQKVALLVGVK